jgi:hypothetical protein
LGRLPPSEYQRSTLAPGLVEKPVDGLIVSGVKLGFLPLFAVLNLLFAAQVCFTITNIEICANLWLLRLNR